MSDSNYPPSPLPPLSLFPLSTQLQRLWVPDKDYEQYMLVGAAALGNDSDDSSSSSSLGTSALAETAQRWLAESIGMSSG